MASSRATGATKRPGFCARVDEEDRQNVGGDKEENGETRKGLLGLFARSWDGDGFARSLGSARELACAWECVPHNAQIVRAVDLQVNAGL